LANATLTVTATLTNGGLNRLAELQQLKRACDLAIQSVHSAGGKTTSGTATAEFGSVSATFTYSPVAAS
jgi:hypothetical protein